MRKLVYVLMVCGLVISLNSCWIMAAGAVGAATGAYIVDKK